MVANFINNQIVTFVDASKFTRNFRKRADANTIKGGLFWKDYIQKLLDQPNCTAM